MQDFRKLTVWTDSMELCKKVYACCRSFPEYEQYALADQLHRAAVSVPSNIAEGASRPSQNAFAYFLEIALGSLFEIETQMTLAQSFGYITEAQLRDFNADMFALQRQLNSLIQRVKVEKN